jgi:predicted transglutaminase-like cysteine proteinase
MRFNKIMLLFLLCFSAFPVSAQEIRTGIPAVTSRMEEGEPVLAPFGHVRFCLQASSECKGQVRGSAAPFETARILALDTINARTNRLIQPHADRSGAVYDQWSSTARTGDCEDYALAKRRALIAQGWAGSNLILAVAKLPNGILHTVLVARTEGGDLVLDNLTNELRAWNVTGYAWIMRQSERNPKLWRRIVRS